MRMNQQDGLPVVTSSILGTQPKILHTSFWTSELPTVLGSRSDPSGGHCSHSIEERWLFFVGNRNQQAASPQPHFSERKREPENLMCFLLNSDLKRTRHKLL